MPETCRKTKDSLVPSRPRRFRTDVMCQAFLKNVTRLARTGRRTRLGGRLTSFRPSGLHSRACFSSAKTTGKWKRKRKLPNDISENFWYLGRKQFCVYALCLCLPTSKIAYKSKAIDKDCFLQTTADVKRDIKSFYGKTHACSKHIPVQLSML